MARCILDSRVLVFPLRPLVWQAFLWNGPCSQRNVSDTRRRPLLFNVHFQEFGRRDSPPHYDRLWLKPPRLVLVTLTVPVADLTCHIKKIWAATSCIATVIPIMPKLEPLVKAACEKMSKPEARNMAEKAFKLWHPWQRRRKGVSSVGDGGAHARLFIPKGADPRTEQSETQCLCRLRPQLWSSRQLGLEGCCLRPHLWSSCQLGLKRHDPRAPTLEPSNKERAPTQEPVLSK